ncbi:unnamed protein product [Nippostrongylus brasiliensis]|uniref:40S ribosomal protein S25 n=1 Tax=Nippostrongylus brasiliensis TaxID=27835 RepID=A0A0N4YH49_NIPBR|nr:unnamed protein product [Nippostrongylus brasiliensis]
MGRSKPRKSRKSLFSSEEQGEEFEKYPNGMHHVISFKSCSRKVKELIDDNDSLINKSVHSSTLKRLVKTKHIKEVLAAKPRYVLFPSKNYFRVRTMLLTPSIMVLHSMPPLLLRHV